MGLVERQRRTMMLAWSLLSVFLGAGIGACLRWGLNLWLTPLMPAMPLGTLAANLVGGYLVGAAIAVFSLRPDLPPEARLFAITGFLGGLTTFSAFSAEVVDALLRGDVGWAVVGVLAHVAGSLALTVLGLWSARWILSSL
jgi:CrcB protein